MWLVYCIKLINSVFQTPNVNTYRILHELSLNLNFYETSLGNVFVFISLYSSYLETIYGWYSVD